MRKEKKKKNPFIDNDEAAAATATAVIDTSLRGDEMRQKNIPLPVDQIASIRTYTRNAVSTSEAQ